LIQYRTANTRAAITIAVTSVEFVMNASDTDVKVSIKVPTPVPRATAELVASAKARGTPAIATAPAIPAILEYEVERVFLVMGEKIL
jgi:hypothetical protein